MLESILNDETKGYLPFHANSSVILWPKVFKYTISVLAVPILLYLHIHFEGFRPGLVWGCLALSFCGFLSLGVGYHRHFTDKSFKAAAPLRLFFLFFGAANQTYSALKWANLHRRHHKYCDDPVRDPLAATRGLFFAHIGWLFVDDHKKTEEFLCNDLTKDQLIMWQHRHYKKLLFFHQYVLPLTIGLLLNAPFGAMAFLGFLKTIIPQQLIFSVNSIGHKYGSREFDQATTATDNHLLALVTLGEGYHNFHHTHAADYRAGIAWYSLDFGKWFIWVASKMGVTYDLKRIKS